MREGAASPARRPRDRKARIIAEAGKLFRSRGFHNVSLADVAGAVGITAPALYRHFRGKQELLLHTVVHGLDTLDEAISGAADLDELLGIMMTLVLEGRGLVALWQREARHLPDTDRADLRDRLSRVEQRVAGLLRAERPELPAADGELLAWGVLSVFASRVGSRTTLPRREFEPLLHELALAVVRCEIPPHEPAPGPDNAAATTFRLRVPRRELLLTEAIRLFDERGFQSVNMTDIGAAAGIAGPSVYKHFAGKADLLTAALLRGSERMHTGMTQALAQATSPRDALERLLRAHIGFALEHSHLIGILISERDELPDKERRATYLAQRDYLDVWVSTLDGTRPALDPAAAKVIVNAVFTLINNLVRTRSVTERPDIDARLADLGLAMLLSG